MASRHPETDFGNCDPGPSKEIIKRLGGHFYETVFWQTISR